MPLAEQNPKKLFGVELWVWEGLGHVVKIFGALGLLLAVYQYFTVGEAERSKETLEMIDHWETREYSDAFQRLRVKVTEFMASIPEEDLAIVRNDEQAADNLRKNMYANILEDETTRQDFDKIVYFFNRLGLCIKAKLCSSQTADTFFKDPLRGFMSNFSNLIADRRKELPGYASGLLILQDKFAID